MVVGGLVAVGLVWTIAGTVGGVLPETGKRASRKSGFAKYFAID
jgi:methylmalonyl-CoA mutase cobalamin-binding subunit